MTLKLLTVILRIKKTDKHQMWWSQLSCCNFYFNQDLFLVTKAKNLAEIPICVIGDYSILLRPKDGQDVKGENFNCWPLPSLTSVSW